MDKVLGISRKMHSIHDTDNRSPFIHDGNSYSSGRAYLAIGIALSSYVDSNTIKM